MQAEIEARGRTGRGQDAASVNVEHVAVHVDLRKALRQHRRCQPVCCCAATVEQAGSCQHESAGADRGDAGAASRGGTQGRNEPRRDRLVDILNTWHDHSVGDGKTVNRPGHAKLEVLRLDEMGFGAYTHLVWRDCAVQGSAAEHLSRHREIERNQPVQRDHSYHVCQAMISPERLPRRARGPGGWLEPSAPWRFCHSSRAPLRATMLHDVWRRERRLNTKPEEMSPVWQFTGESEAKSGRFRRLHAASMIEGSTLVLLVFVAVPLKHFGGRPIVVTILGPIHGLAFLYYMLTVIEAVVAGGWMRGEIARLLLIAFIPFGGFANLPFLLRKDVARSRSVKDHG